MMHCILKTKKLYQGKCLIPMDTATKDIDMMEVTWAARLESDFSNRSQIHFWYLANFPTPKSSSSS